MSLTYAIAEHLGASTDLAAEDLIAYKVRNILAGDETLINIFGAEYIELAHMPIDADQRTNPRIQVSPFATTDEPATGPVSG